MDLRDERARRIDRIQPPRRRALVDRGLDPVGRENDGLALRDLPLVLDEDRAALLELSHDVRVVHDLLANVNGRAVPLERLLDRLDCTLHPGAVPPRRSQEHTLHQTASHGSNGRAGASGRTDGGRFV